MKHRSTVAFIVLVTTLAAAPQALQDLNKLTTAAEHKVMARIWSAFLSLHSQRSEGGEAGRPQSATAGPDSKQMAADLRRGRRAGGNASPRQPRRPRAIDRLTRGGATEEPSTLADLMADEKVIERFVMRRELNPPHQARVRVSRAIQDSPEILRHFVAFSEEKDDLSLPRGEAAPAPVKARRAGRAKSSREAADFVFARLGGQGLRFMLPPVEMRTHINNAFRLEVEKLKLNNEDQIKAFRVRAPGKLGCTKAPAPPAALEPPPSRPVLAS